MKKPKILLLTFILTIFSCADPGGDPIYEGLEFDFRNKTNEKYDIEIVIGGMSNGNFISTDSIVMPSKIQENSSKFFYLDENRWKPNLNKIRDIPSERCYFKIKLSNDKKEIIKRYGKNEYMSLLLPSNNAFVGDYGRLIIAIWDNEITGYASKEL